MKYPAVFRDTNTSSSGDSNQQTVLIYQDGDAIHLAGKFKGQYTTHWSTFNAINITKEYLQNTYGEVQSPEHAGIIIELAKNAGFEFGSAKPDLEAVKSFMIYSDCFDVYSFDVSELSNESNRKQITIPLPPKADNKANVSYTVTKGIKRIDGCEDFELCGTDSARCAVNVSVSFNDDNEILKVKVINAHEADSKKWTPDFYELGELPKHFDCVCSKCGGKCCTGRCDKQESSEWPQIGDEVCWSNGKRKGELKSICDGWAWIKDDGGEFVSLMAKFIKKPKTPEEKLRDDILDCDNFAITESKATQLANWLTNKGYEIKKKPQ